MEPTPTVRKPLYKSLYVQVVTAIIIGVLLGHFFPSTGEAMRSATPSRPPGTR